MSQGQAAGSARGPSLPLILAISALVALGIRLAVASRTYSLYHVLNHFNLFGGSYGSQAEAILRRTG